VFWGWPNIYTYAKSIGKAGRIRPAAIEAAADILVALVRQ
jgi:hypothetical protein